MSSYGIQLSSPQWQKKRLEVMQAANWRCQFCGDENEELHVHHPFYRYSLKPWEYRASELRCLCRTCHTASHITKSKLVAAIKHWPSDSAEIPALVRAAFNLMMFREFPSRRIPGDARNDWDKQIMASREKARAAYGAFINAFVGVVKSHGEAEKLFRETL